MKKRHRWNGNFSTSLCWCLDCHRRRREIRNAYNAGIGRYEYLHRDGKWRTKAPPCEPEKVEET